MLVDDSDATVNEDTASRDELDVSQIPVVGSPFRTEWRFCTRISDSSCYGGGPQERQYQFVVERVTEAPKEIVVRGQWPKHVLMWGDVEIASFKIEAAQTVEEFCDIHLESSIQPVEDAWEVFSILLFSGMGCCSQVNLEDVGLCCERITTDKLIIGQTAISIKSRLSEFAEDVGFVPNSTVWHRKIIITKLLRQAKVDVLYLSDNNLTDYIAELFPLPTLEVLTIFGRIRNWRLYLLARFFSFSCISFCFRRKSRKNVTLSYSESFSPLPDFPNESSVDIDQDYSLNNLNSAEENQPGNNGRDVSPQLVEYHPAGPIPDHVILSFVAETDPKVGAAPTIHDSENVDNKNERPKSQIPMGSISAKDLEPKGLTEINASVGKTATNEGEMTLIETHSEQFPISEQSDAVALRRSSIRSSDARHEINLSRPFNKTGVSAGSTSSSASSQKSTEQSPHESLVRKAEVDDFAHKEHSDRSYSSDLSHRYRGRYSHLGYNGYFARLRSSRRNRYGAHPISRRGSDTSYEANDSDNRWIGRKNLLLMGVIMLACVGGVATAITNPAKRTTWFEQVEDTAFVVLGLFIPLFTLLIAYVDGKLRVRLPYTRAPKSVREVVFSSKGMNRQKVLESAAWYQEWSDMLGTENMGFKITDRKGEIEVSDEVQLSDILKRIWKFGKQHAFNTLSGEVFRYVLVPREKGWPVIRIYRSVSLRIPEDAEFFVGRYRGKGRYIIR